jgi:hypothetical protein
MRGSLTIVNLCRRGLLLLSWCILAITNRQYGTQHSSSPYLFFFV